MRVASSSAVSRRRVVIRTRALAGAGQQRPDLVAAGGVVQDEQQPLAGDPVAPQAGARVGAGRDLAGRDPDGLQQAGQRIGGRGGALAGGVGVQRQEDLPVGVARRQLPGGADRQRGLAGSGHPADHDDAARPGRVLELAQLGCPAGERGGVAGQRPRRRRARRAGPRRGPRPGKRPGRGRTGPARRRAAGRSGRGRSG